MVELQSIDTLTVSVDCKSLSFGRHDEEPDFYLFRMLECHCCPG
jgi:hypothetical protein